MSDERPFFPQDLIDEAIGYALHESVVSSFMRNRWPPPKPRPWYVRLWWRVDRYLPRVSVRLGPRPE